MPFPEEGHGRPPEDFQAWLTTFKVLAAFKGIEDSSKAVELVHFTYSERLQLINNGAQFASFTVGPVEREVIETVDGKGGGRATEYQYRPTWLAYLKKRPDGRYEPVTGHYDAQPSFKEINNMRAH